MISFDRRHLLMSVLYISATIAMMVRAKQCSYRDITLSLITEQPTTMSYLMCGSDYFHISARSLAGQLFIFCTFILRNK